ncbi:MAG: NADH-ubiquinone oxidoreductase-F iron-sulfur binding region domain-containing protein [Burkholderiaceae bacterium]
MRQKGRRPIGFAKGRQAGSDELAHVRTLLGDMPRRRDLLIEALHRLQDHDGHLRAGSLAALASEFRLAQTEVFEVATFYHHFDVLADDQPAPPPVTVRVCESLSCDMAGAGALTSLLRARHGQRVRIQPVPCVGRCEQAPVAVVQRFPIGPATAEAVDEALAGGRHECPVPDTPFPGQVADHPAYRVLADLVAGSTDRESLFARLEQAGLRGMGGAGFPAGRKWRIVAGQAAPRMLVVNADEGEPGTFKDRHLLENDPHPFLAGMLIAAWAVECTACYIYLRDEYAGLRGWLERALTALRAAPPFDTARWPMPELHLRRGAGAYICGEESGLLESLEGRRGMPRLRPPYIAETGLFGHPTLAHNVETLHWVPAILAGDEQSFAAHGRRARKGLRRFSVSGRVAEPGVKLAPAGISLNELIAEHCGGMAAGHTLYGFLPGGASGGILPAALADEPLDFDTLQKHGSFIGSAAVIVLSQADKAREAATNLMRFFRHESCGQCTPCRVGTAKAVEMMDEARWPAASLQDLAQVMADASICGLGQAAPNPFLSVIRHFGHEVGDG